MQRRYQMTRIRAGDYLLPSNDARTLWRVYQYDEDGSAAYLVNGEWIPVTGSFWALAKFNGSLERLPDDLTDWEHWDYWAGGLRTRRDAVADALK